jgi:hypothetical protein
MARLLRPWQERVRARLVDPKSSLDEDTQKLAWFYLTNSYNSDGQWPPTLPDSPHIVHPYNYAYCFENLLKADLLVGGVEKENLPTSPADTLIEILALQQKLILDKAEGWLASGSDEQKLRAARARRLVQKSVDVSGVRRSGLKILYPSEYRVRAGALVEARKLVDGIVIETE